MPLGLCKAPATFQALMEDILQELRLYTSGLLDDIAIWEDAIEKLYDRALQVFTQLAKYEMIMNTTKTQFFVRRRVFLGFLISENGIEADPSKLSSVWDREMPRTITEIRIFVNAALPAHHQRIL